MARAEARTDCSDTLSRNLPVKVRPKFADCLHCRGAVPTFDYFMLREEVWLSVHTTNRGMMHLECVEERLGRTLRRIDFATQERINGMMCHLSPLLRSRYSPSRQELRRGSGDFVALLAKHEDVLIRLLKRFHLDDAGRIHGWRRAARELSESQGSCQGD